MTNWLIITFAAHAPYPRVGSVLWIHELAQRLPMPRMRHLCSSPDARAGCERQACGLADVLEREGIELRRDLAFEPRLVALPRMLARPALELSLAAAQPGADRVAQRGLAASLALQLRAPRTAAATPRSDCPHLSTSQILVDYCLPLLSITPLEPEGVESFFVGEPPAG
jgi:hypothetical protein